MIIEIHFDSSRDTEAGVKQEFLAQVDDSFKKNIEIVDVHNGKLHESVPANVKFDTESDAEAMKIEAEWFMSAKYGDVSAVAHP